MLYKTAELNNAPFTGAGYLLHVSDYRFTLICNRLNEPIHKSPVAYFILNGCYIDENIPIEYTEPAGKKREPIIYRLRYISEG